jgi:hypothetical protein
MNRLLPAARTTDIIEQEAGNELAIYDLQTNKAYNLNETSKNVYRACNGKMTFEDLRSRYKYTDDLIYFALDELKANNLVEEHKSVHFAGINRREVIKRVGLGTMIALPVIVGITAPKAAHAASGTASLGQACNNNCAAPNQCTQVGNGAAICRAPAGQPCDFSRPDLCVSLTCGAPGPRCL